MTWTLWYEARPWTGNKDREMHYHVRAKLTREWRHAFCILAKQQRIPHLDWAQIVAIPHQRTRQYTADVSACYPAVKAAIDGIVDAHVLKDDKPIYVPRIIFEAPIIDGHDGLELRILCDNVGDRNSHP